MPETVSQESAAKVGKILKSKADSDVNMKHDLFEFDLELRSSDSLVEQKKPLH